MGLIRWKLVFLLFSVLTLVKLIDRFTNKSGAISGNGNPALPFIFLLIPIFIWFSYEWIVFVKQFSNRSLLCISMFIVSLLYLVYGSYITIESHMQYKSEFITKGSLRQGSSNVDTHWVDLATNGITYYTNTLYFNYMTFLLAVSVLNISAIIFHTKKHRKPLE